VFNDAAVQRFGASEQQILEALAKTSNVAVMKNVL